jgi:hypothetical protein
MAKGNQTCTQCKCKTDHTRYKHWENGKYIIKPEEHLCLNCAAERGSYGLPQINQERMEEFYRSENGK